jgi:DNA-binding MarR family transcriptional regulator
MTRAELLGDLEREVGVLIRRVRRVIHTRSRMVHPDLQPASYLLLSHLAHEGPIRSSAVAETFGIDKGAVSRQVHALVELGLVVRTPDPADGRATLLTVSDDARARLDEVNRYRRKYLDERLGEWSEDDLRSFVQALERYNTSLED